MSLEALPRSTEAFAENLWYIACAGKRLKRGAMRGQMLFGEPILIGRRQDETVFAIRDICAHRAAKLSCGRFDGFEVECPYHGWRFNTQGTCTAIPSLTADKQIEVSRIRVPNYYCAKSQGVVWIYKGDKPPTEEPPIFPGVEGRVPQVAESLDLECDMDNAVYGLLDPAHAPYVHNSWYFRSNRVLREKSKHYQPSDRGFTMVKHALKNGGAAYKLLGNEVTTEISFELPGLRIESISGSRGAVSSVTAMTPVTPERTQMTHLLYWTAGWIAPFTPIVAAFTRAFIRQDQTILENQHDGLRFGNRMMLIDEADTLAKWYFKLKSTWQKSQSENTPFENPIEETVLRWRT